MNPILVATGIALSAKVISLICDELSEEEKRIQSELKQEKEKYIREYEKQLTKEKDNISKVLKKNRLEEQKKYINYLIQGVNSRIEERKSLRDDIKESIDIIKKSFKSDSLTPLRKSSLERLLRQLSITNEKCFSYVIYLEMFKKYLDQLKLSDEFIVDIPVYQMRLPENFPYIGKMITNQIKKSDLLDGNINVTVDKLCFSYHIYDAELLEEWEDESYIPLFVNEYNRQNGTYELSIEKGMFYQQGLDNTHVGIECTVAKLEERGAVLRYKKNLLMYLPNSFLDNPNKRPLVRTTERVFVCDWGNKLGNCSGVYINKKGDISGYDIKVAENPRFCAMSARLSHMPILFKEEDFAKFAAFLMENNFFDESAEWKIGVFDEDNVVFGVGTKFFIQLSNYFVIEVEIIEINSETGNTFSAKYLEVYSLDGEHGNGFDSDNIFMTIDCDIMPVSIECLSNMFKEIDICDLSMFWMECFAELSRQREIKKSQTGLKYFQQWGEITEKLITHLKKGKNFSIKIRKNNIKVSNRIFINDEEWENFEKNVRRYVVKKIKEKEQTLVKSYLVYQDFENSIDFSDDFSEIFLKDYFNYKREKDSIYILIKSPFSETTLPIEHYVMDKKNNRILLEIDSRDILYKTYIRFYDEAKEILLDREINRMSFITEDLNKNLYDVKIFPVDKCIEVIGNYPSEQLENVIELYAKELPDAEIKQINAYNSFRVGQLLNGELQSFLLDGSKVKPLHNPEVDKIFIDEKSLNKCQFEALKNAYFEKNLYLIQGPPGTGKTTVIKQLIKQYIASNPNIRILIASQANVAVDNVLKGLLKDNVSSNLIIRCGNEHKIDPELQAIALDAIYGSYLKELKKRRSIDSEIYDKWIRFVKPTKGINPDLGEMLIRRKKIVGATCVGISKKKIGLEREEFDIVIIDEAGKALPLELLIPIIKAKKVILIGDHKQLPPVINPALFNPEKIEIQNRQYVINQLFNDSYFKSLYESVPNSNKCMLNVQYRMPEVIGTMISELFYDGSITNGNTTYDKSPVFHKKNLVFFDMSSISQYLENETEYSVQNLYEAAFVTYKVKKMLSKKSDIRIAIITPYKAQKRIMQNLLLQSDIDMSKVACDTVDSFQGDEAEVVIFCMTRATKPTRYFSDERRLNVAFSRAKNELIIVGSKYYFAKFSINSVMPKIWNYLQDNAQIITEKYNSELLTKSECVEKVFLPLTSIIIDEQFCSEEINENERSKYIDEYYRCGNKIVSPIVLINNGSKYFLKTGINIYSACEMMEQEECICVIA